MRKAAPGPIANAASLNLAVTHDDMDETACGSCRGWCRAGAGKRYGL